MEPQRIADALTRATARLEFGPPVTHVYNPLRYAKQPHAAYVERYARQGIEALFLGMNPGPWGMAQTGVPFGEVALVRDWLGIEAPVGKPKHEHPKRPITGFACERSEVSGRRLWGWAKNRFGVELDTGDLREAGPGVRREIQSRLEEVAFQKIDDAQLEEIPLFADKNYGAERLSKWIKTKFTFEVEVDHIIKHHKDDLLEPRDLVIEKARDLYSTREAELPVDIAMQNAMSRAMQDPNAAFEELALWAKNRAGVEIDPSSVKTTPP